MAKAIKQKDINLLLAMNAGPAKKEVGSSGRILILAIVIVVLLVAAAFAFLYIQKNTLENEKNIINDYLQNPATVSAYNESLSAQSDATRMQSQSDQLEQVLLAISSFPKITSAYNSEVFRIAGDRVDVSNFTFDVQTGVLNFDATSDTPSGVPLFIAQLRLSGMFKDLQYAGYAETGSTIPGTTTTDPTTGQTTTSNVSVSEYSFSVSCLAPTPVPTLPPSLGQ